MIVTARGMPRASTTMCRFDPSLPRSVGLGPVSWPSGAGDAGSTEAGAFPIDLVVLTQPTQHRQMLPMPYTGRLPVSQTSPTRHATAEAQFLREVFPRDAGLQHIQDAVERSSVIDRAPPSALGRWGEFRNQRFQCHPKFIADFASCHIADDTISATSCLGYVSGSKASRYSRAGAGGTSASLYWTPRNAIWHDRARHGSNCKAYGDVAHTLLSTTDRSVHRLGKAASHASPGWRLLRAR